MFFVTGSIQGFAFTGPGLPVYPNEALLKKLISLPVKEMEVISGRRLTLKEKIGLKLLQWKYKRPSTDGEKDPGAKADKRAQASMTMGIAGVAFLVAGLFVPLLALFAIPCGIIALITGLISLGKTKNNTKSIIGIVLGSLLIILLLALILDIIRNSKPKI